MMNLTMMRPARRCPRTAARRGFTLIEMLVSLAVIAVALVIVVSAFTITTDTARQAAAFSEVSAVARQVESQLREDLRNIKPSESILAIVGGVQAAAGTPAELAARKYLRVLVGDPARVPNGYDPQRSTGLDSNNFLQAQYSDPRTDILLFFTNRAAPSQAPLPGSVALNLTNQLEGPQAAYRDGARLSPLLVAYGHAAFGETQLSNNGLQWSDVVRHIFKNQSDALSDFPAQQWHLARRALLIEPERNPPTGANAYPFDRGLDPTAVYRRIQRCYPDVSAKRAGDVVTFDLAGFLANPNFDPLRYAYQWPVGGGWPSTPTPSSNHRPHTSTAYDLVDRLLYPAGSERQRHIATVLPAPPPELASNSALDLAPGCAWFQVEFLMPEDPRNAIDNPDINTRSENLRWVSVPPGATYLFIPDSSANRAAIVADGARLDGQGRPDIAGRRLADFGEVNPDDANLANPRDDDLTDRRVRLWPYALRVTVRLYDPRGRLRDPLVRSFVHRFD